MRVLFFSRLFWPHIGGIERHIEEISKILIKKGYKVTVLTTKFSKDLSVKESHEGIEIIRFNQPDVKFIGLINTWLWLLKNINLIKKSDIVHIHDVFNWYWPIKLIMPLKRVFVTFHGQWGKYPIPFKDKIQKKIGAIFSNGVITIGEYINKYYGIKSDVTSYGAANKPGIKKDNKKNIILYVGRLDKTIPLSPILKTIKLFVDSNHRSNIDVIFCGDGGLKNECEKYGRVVGFANPYLYYSEAKFVFASGYLTVLEALANKCLVFATYENPLQEDYYKISPFKKFIVISSKPEVLFSKLNYYQTHPKETAKRIDAGYNWVNNQTWAKLTDEYIKLWI